MRLEFDYEMTEAEDAERNSEFFRAASLYRLIAKNAFKNKDSKLIRFCKQKIVEMNKKSIQAKEFREISSQYRISDTQIEAEQQYIARLLNESNVKNILRKLGSDASLTPKVKDLQRAAESTAPIFLSLGSLSAVSNDGHLLKGGGIPAYFWFIRLYEESQYLVFQRYIVPVIRSTMENHLLNIQELKEYFIESELFDEDNLSIILIGIERYLQEDYVSALHILVPQFESLVLT